MKDISKELGLPVSLNGTKLLYDANELKVEPKTRTLEEAKAVYANAKSSVEDLYSMYRYFEKEQDKRLFDQNQLEYDVTLLNPGKIGEEFVKTAGHYHGNVPGFDFSYPEVYEIVTGKVEYLCQTKPDENGEVEVLYVLGQEGDKVVVPPNYGHVSLNPTNEVVVESNLQLKDLPATADYQTFADYTGGALYRTPDGLKENSNYKIKSLRIVTPKEKPEWGLTKNLPLYTAFLKKPEAFGFLVHPQNYDFDDLFEDAKL
jgi:glucose-6-phosphate isomerase